MRRVVKLAAWDVRTGDVILVYPEGSEGMPNEADIIEHRLDRSDGSIYVRWQDRETGDLGSDYYDPHAHIKVVWPQRD